MSNKKAIFLFNESLTMPMPWALAGYECHTFDGKHKETTTQYFGNSGGSITNHHFWFEADRVIDNCVDVMNKVGPGVKFIASFAECTYLTTTGARWFYHPEDKHLPYKDRRPHPNYPNRRKDQADAVVLAKMVRSLAQVIERINDDGKEIPWMLENPAISSLNTLWRKPDYKFDPCDYGGYLLADQPHPTFPDVYPPQDAYRKNTGIWAGGGFVMPGKIPVYAPKGFPGFLKAGGKSDRTKEIRSTTPGGFAKAVQIFNER